MGTWFWPCVSAVFLGLIIALITYLRDRQAHRRVIEREAKRLRGLGKLGS